jgi:hypothetical protein
MHRWKEKLMMAVVWRLPRWAIYWSVIRAGAHATTGKFGNTHPDSLNMFDILNRWDESNESSETGAGDTGALREPTSAS